MLAVTDPDRVLDLVTDEMSWLFDRAATFLRTQGETRHAHLLFQRLHQLSHDRQGVDHPDTLALASNLALVLRDVGEHERTRTPHEDVLVRWRRVLGESIPTPSVGPKTLL